MSSIGQSLYGMYVSGSNIANAIVDGENVSVGDVLGFAMSAVSLSHAAKDLGTSYCFVGDTPVWTSEGLKPIEDIQIGNEVLSEDETTGEIGLKKVYDISINETDEFYHIHVNGEEIVATGTHPFYVDGFGWTLAGNLRAGDVLVLSNGRHVVVEWVDHEITESPVLVYNFEVEDFHTYFVGESGILVHNGKYCANGDLGCGTSASKSDRTPTNDKNDSIPTFEVSRKKYPNHAQMLDNAQKNGHSLEALEKNSETRAAKKNRYNAQKNARKMHGAPPKGYDYDEFPYASTKQGGLGAHVELVPSSENQDVGRALGIFYRKHHIQDGDIFNVRIVL